MHRLLAIVMLFAAHASAHEFWIMPDQLRLEPDTALRVQMFHGERFAGDVVLRNTPYIERFEYVSGAETLPVLGRHARPNSFTRPKVAGSGVVVYQSGEALNVLPPARFEAYLAEEGLGEISRRRVELGETDQTGREAYIRCAKSLVGVGDAPVSDRQVDLPLEIMIEQMPESETDQIVARVLFEGEPVPGLRLVAVSEARHDELIELETDEEGRIALTPSEGGPWMLTTLHMVRMDDRDDVDWLSYWSSITFQIER